MNYWIIGGASRGVGEALLQQLPASDRVLGLARDSERFAEVKSSLSLGHAQLRACDLRDSVATNNVVENFLSKDAGTVVVVNCAATWTGGRSTLELKASDYADAFNLNFLTAVNLCQAVLQHWDKCKRSYRLVIVNLGATASVRGGKKTSSFAVSKSALRIYSQSMAKELGPEGVHVAHVIIDGLIDNSRTKKLNEGRDLDRYISQDALIQTIHHLVEQPRDCWTFELDLRPYNENW